LAWQVQHAQLVQPWRSTSLQNKNLILWRSSINYPWSSRLPRCKPRTSRKKKISSLFFDEKPAGLLDFSNEEMHYRKHLSRKIKELQSAGLGSFFLFWEKDCDLLIHRNIWYNRVYNTSRWNTQPYPIYFIFAAILS
jgi:hypothetical protein